MMKVVGVTCSTITAEGVRKQALNRTYVRALEAVGVVPIILPVTDRNASIDRLLGIVDGLLFTGGVDIAPERYGQSPIPELGEVDTDRDAAEIPLMRAAISQDLPILCICRGIQLLNVATGGALYQDVRADGVTTHDHQQTNHGAPRDALTHTVHVEPGSRLREIVGESEIRTNSLHHQSLRDLGMGVQATAFADDGVVEGAEIPGNRWVVAVQWHPEETAPFDEPSKRLFRRFAEAL